MTSGPLARVALAALLGVTLRLLPPGHRDRLPPPGPIPGPLPTALARGSRAQYGQGVGPMPMRAALTPSTARLGQRLHYHGEVHPPAGATVSIAPPRTAGDFTWSEVRTGTGPVARRLVPVQLYGADSVWVEGTLQVFATGAVAVPGPELSVRGPGAGGPVRTSRLPTLYLYVLPTVTRADTAATLRPLRGPLAAPWWERVPWSVVAGVLLLLALALAIRRWLAARKRRPPVAAPAAPAPVRAFDPVAEALAALARLRAERLPQQSRFGEHALALTLVLRRYLERTAGTPRPGDTSGELVEHLRASAVAEEDLAALGRLLALWDGVKFARAPTTAAEAERCEQAVEQLVRRRDVRGAVA